MFIILFGLLGVAALLELGRFDSALASRQDRAAACAESAFADLNARRLVDPRCWIRWYDQPPFTSLPYWAPVAAPYPPWVYNVAPNQTAAWRRVGDAEANPQGAYVIDPLYILRNLSSSSTPVEIASQVARFPYSPSIPAMPRVFVDAPNRLGVPLTVDVATLAALADRQFIWPDDQVFDLPKDPQQRPKRMFDGANVGFYEGNYSWMATVAADGGAYEVSIVVFYQRDFSPPSAPADPDMPGERILAYTDSSGAVQPGVVFLGGGWGGGDVRLQVDSINSAALGPAKKPAYLDLREGDWILLYGFSAGQWTIRWYRVISVGGEATLLNPNQPPSNTNPWTRLVTLAGPDWRIDNNQDGVIDDAWGVLCTGVVGVYTHVVTRDR